MSKTNTNLTNLHGSISVPKTSKNSKEAKIIIQMRLFHTDLTDPTDYFLSDEPHLEKLISFDTRNFDAMFVLARAYYMQGNYDKAANLYDKIASQTKSEQKKQEALSNKKIVLDASYSK